MTTPAHTRTAMTDPPDTAQPPTHSQPAANPAAAAAGTAAGQAKRERAARSLSPTGPLIAIIVLLAGAVGGLVLRDLNRLDARFDDVDARFDDVDARFDEFESDVDARFDEFESDVDARFDAQDAKIDEINLKLTALIAALNKTDQVDAALTGRLPTPDAEHVEPRSALSGL